MELQQFLNESYTAYHTTENLQNILTQNGFSQLTMGQKWNLSRGGKYFVTRNGSSIVAFSIGNNNIFNICESHTDSPSFKVKSNGTIESCGVSRLNTEKYGGGLLYTFFDRPLKIAGRVVVKTDSGVEVKNVVSNYNVVIPSLCIHHNPTANDGFAVKTQNDTLPLLGFEKTDIYSTLANGVIDADLYVVPATQAFLAGANNDFLCSARLDNLTSAFTSVQAIIKANPKDIAVVACLDNEEIGSGTRQGSPDFLEQVLVALSDSLGLSADERLFARENGFVLSVDNGHAVHPAHPEKSDPVSRAYMGKGVVLKHHVNYSTDGVTSAIFKRLLTLANVNFQDYYNNSDVRCGSTLGLATARRLGIKACDIGLAQLAMHSACETCSVSDVQSMQNALLAFLSAKITENGNSFSIEL